MLRLIFIVFVFAPTTSAISFGCLPQVSAPPSQDRATELPWIKVAGDNSRFILDSLSPEVEFRPLGFNYDHDEQGRLLEDYWETEWPKVESDFVEMKSLGANVVRVHLQLGKFMAGPDEPNEASLQRLAALVELARSQGLYLDLTGLGCYHKQDVPAWYDDLPEQVRWDVQARFWEAIVLRCHKSPAVFCYDLMNEPVVPGGRRAERDWLGPPFAGKHFVQFVTLDQADRARPDIARDWIKHLVAAIRKVDQRHLISVGLVDWSLDRQGLTSGFVPEKIVADLDFISVHIYPESGKLADAIETLEGFAVGKPVVVEETFPLKCSTAELVDFMDRAGKQSAGWISFYWGKSLDELRQSSTIGDAILLEWLTRFEARAKQPK